MTSAYHEEQLVPEPGWEGEEAEAANTKSANRGGQFPREVLDPGPPLSLRQHLGLVWVSGQSQFEVQPGEAESQSNLATRAAPGDAWRAGLWLLDAP